ncbi:CRISPR-associated endoribonuclease Cas6 [Peptococcaceae bacterium 1198_IL3148]
MLLSLVIILKVEKETLVPPSMGQVLHAFFLDSVRQVNPALSEELHQSSGIKPFTVSPLNGKVTYQDNRWRLYPGETYWFRVTSIESKLSQWLLEVWSASLLEEIKLAGAEFKLVSVTSSAEQHPWAGLTTYEEIYNRCVGNTEVSFKIGMDFSSPTTFRDHGSNYPLPDPIKVFNNLLKKWDAYSPVSLGGNFIEFIEANVYPSMFRLQTKIMHFDRYKQVGFTGSCQFAIRSQQDAIFISVMHMLSQYAFYAGVGYKTTMGMGQVKPKGRI